LLVLVLVVGACSRAIFAAAWFGFASLLWERACARSLPLIFEQDQKIAGKPAFQPATSCGRSEQRVAARRKRCSSPT
jgi:hypothetical protein